MLRRLALLGLVSLVGCSSRERAENTSSAPAPSTRTTFTVGNAHPIELRLSPRADAPFRLRDPRTNVGVAVRLRGAEAIEAMSNASESRFPKGFLGRHDMALRPVNEGVEDFIHFDVAPEKREVEYELTLDPEVAGLRLISNILELLDAEGVPRLRMAAPWIEHDGVRHDVNVDVVGCTVDTDGRVPWSRPVVNPGARSCVVQLRWDADVAYPALLDPAWTSTGSVSTGHNNAPITMLANGDVLIVGGCTIGTTLNAVAEIYGATTGVWTTTTPIPSKRALHTATLLDDGSVLVVGGDSTTSGICFSTGSAIKDSQIYKAGAWTTVATPVARTTHNASKLPDGKVLVAAGTNGSGYARSADIFDPATKTWSTTSAMIGAHSQAAQVTLSSGNVLVAGGYIASGTVGSAAELWDRATSKWIALPSMSKTRVFFGMVAMPDGTAIVAGGRETAAVPPPYPADIDRYSPTTNTWSKIGTLPQPRQSLGSIGLPNGNALFVGGTQIVSTGTYVTYANVYMISPSGTVEAWPALALTRASPGVTVFGTARDRVMVAGGVTVGSVPKSVEITKPGAAAGATCTKSSDCAISLVCAGSTCAAPSSDAGIDASDVGIDASDVGTDARDAAADSSVSDSSVADTSADAGAPIGAACASPGACASGFCVDGVCCDAACTSSCLACSGAKNITGIDGTCAPAKADQADPRGSCVDTGATSCGSTGKCDGAGGCAYYAEGTACGTGKACDGAGTCTDLADAGADAEPDAIADTGVIADATTDVGFTPVDPSATPTISAGLATSCKSDAECSSGHCIEGVCCDRPCDGVCESCVLPTSPGKCALVPLGLDPKKGCSAVPCVRTCGGTGECVAAFVGAQCSVSRCTSPNAGVGPTVCSAVGAACPPAQPFDCGAYACNPAFGACLRDCRTSEDCAPGNVCNVASGRCEAAPTEGDSGGCSVGPTSDASGASLLGFGALGLAALGLTRRRARR